jgi:hypothetical protein
MRNRCHSENLKEINHLEDHEAEGWQRLKEIFKKWVWGGCGLHSCGLGYCHLRYVLNAAMNLRVTQKMRFFPISYTTISTSKRTLFHGVIHTSTANWTSPSLLCILDESKSKILHGFPTQPRHFSKSVTPIFDTFTMRCGKRLLASSRPSAWNFRET